MEIVLTRAAVAPRPAALPCSNECECQVTWLPLLACAASLEAGRQECAACEAERPTCGCGATAGDNCLGDVCDSCHRGLCRDRDCFEDEDMRRGDR